MSSVARLLSSSEAAQVAETARGLPDTWCLVIEAPFGQLAISPVRERRRHTLAWVALPAERRITREPWRPAR